MNDKITTIMITITVTMIPVMDTAMEARPMERAPFMSPLSALDCDATEISKINHNIQCVHIEETTSLPNVDETNVIIF